MTAPTGDVVIFKIVRSTPILFFIIYSIFSILYFRFRLKKKG